ncbi:MAG: hypothetical protein J07HB67_02848 [halophilic archaeon J07HB67]|nr:MAG: hypothetical protein J07HB67_02848 [halophilic archaeon J07HB67]
MTRFDATTESERRELFAEAVRAHRDRGGPFVTVEAATVADGHAVTTGDENDGEEPVERVPPWIQFGEGAFNLDCTDAELDPLRTVVDDYPESQIDRLESPDEAEATNVGITAHTSEDRLAAFADRVFREVYGQPDDFRLWVTAM